MLAIAAHLRAALDALAAYSDALAATPTEEAL